MQSVGSLPLRILCGSLLASSPACATLVTPVTHAHTANAAPCALEVQERTAREPFHPALMSYDIDTAPTEVPGVSPNTMPGFNKPRTREFTGASRGYPGTWNTCCRILETTRLHNKTLACRFFAVVP